MPGNTPYDRIQALIAAHPIVLFMKGDKLFPQCGFSARAVQLLQHAGATFETVNVLEDDDIRQGVKTFSDWPTIPQLYVRGEFIGGCDILNELHATGELAALLDGAPA